MLDRICTAVWELDIVSFLADAHFTKAPSPLRVLAPSALIACNRKARDLMAQLAEGTDEAGLVLPLDTCAAEAAVLACLAGQPAFESAVRIEQGGSTAWFHLSLSFPAEAESEGSGNGTLVMSAFEISRYRREETDLHKARRHLEQASRDMNMVHLARSVTDAVSQPVTSILFSGRAALTRLSESDHRSAELRADIERMLLAASRSAELIRQAREFAEKRESELETLAVSDVVANVLPQLEREFSTRGLRLLVEIADDTPEVTADRIQLQQVLLNLILNAMDAHEDRQEDTGPLTPITVSARAGENAELLVSIADNGHGIAPDIAGRIFEPLFTTKPGNVGVGLAVCRNIVEAHGGEIWVSDSQGPGATFSFTLPADGIIQKPR